MRLQSKRGLKTPGGIFCFENINERKEKRKQSAKIVYMVFPKAPLRPMSRVIQV